MASDVLITPSSGLIQFSSSVGSGSGQIKADGDDLVISNVLGDVLLGDGASDIFIGDGTNNVDIVFEQNGEIKDDGSGKSITLGSKTTTLVLSSSSDITMQGGGGNVGIGTSTATVPLQVAGDISSSGNFNLTGDLSGSGNIKLTQTSDIILGPMSTFPTTNTTAIQWDFPSDDTFIYAQQSSSDVTTLVFEQRDNTTSDANVFWFNDYQGATKDSFPLYMDGGKLVVNYIYDRRVVFARDATAINGKSNNVDFYLLKSGSTSVSTANSLIHGDVSAGKTTLNDIVFVDGNITASGNISSSGFISASSFSGDGAGITNVSATVADESITLAKLAHAAANTVMVRDANSEGDPSFKAVTNTQILIGDGTGFTAAALSGDVTMTNGGVVTIGANAVEGSMLNTNVAGTGLTVAGNNIDVDAAQTQITSVGTLTGLFVDSHITASGNISSSGTIIAEHLETTDDLTVADDIILGDLSLISYGGAGRGKITGSALNLIVGPSDLVIQTGSANTAFHIDTTAKGNVGIEGAADLIIKNNITSSVDSKFQWGALGGNRVQIQDGNITASGNISGSNGNILGFNTITATSLAGTLTTAAQGNVTSLGTLTTLTVDDITINGSTISDGGAFDINVGGDITLDAAGKDINLTDGSGTAEFIFNLEDAPELDVDGDFTIDGSGLIKLDSATNNINLVGNVTASGDISSSGNITTNVKQHIFSKTSTTDADFQGDVVYIGNSTTNNGKIYHYKSDGTWEEADADAAANCDGLLGVALGSNSTTNGMLLRGMVTLDHDPGAVGDVLFLATGASGHATATAPSGNTDIVRVVGYCLDASNGQIWFNPDNTFVEVSA